MAVNKNIVLLLPLLGDPSDCVIEVLDDGILEDIFDGEDLVAVDAGVDGHF
jgi:hypothetical protein